MKVAIFLDVDRTITADLIQKGFAHALGCEEGYLEIEEGFQDNPIQSQSFGDRIIKLFNSHGFTEDRVAQIAPTIALQPWADKLLRLDVDRYFVSSGPSYYIDWLASRYQIPEGNVFCSNYIFDPKTKKLIRCDAVNHVQKNGFVGARVAEYDITVGIGDDPKLDQFVGSCTIPLLMAQTEYCMCAPNLASAVPMIEKIAQLAKSRSKESAKPQSEADTLEKLAGLPLGQLFHRFSTGVWVMAATVLIGIAVTSFGAGAWLMRTLPAVVSAPGGH